MRLEDARLLKTFIASAPVTFEMPGESSDPGVSVGIAPREDGEFRLAVRARERTAAAEAEIERIVALAGGEVDVRFTGRIIAAQVHGQAAVAGPLRIGASVAHVGSTAGTLGCFARDDDGVVGLISNNHVIALEDRGTAGDEILHPSPADHGVTPQNVIARLRSPYPRIRGGTKIVDCAFGEIVDGVAWDPSLRSGKRLRASPGPVTKKLSVFKYGRTTHATEGRVLAFEVDKVVVDYAGGFSVRFDDQIEIEPDSGVFADRGDSGALVHDEDRYAVGLLFAVIENRALAYANPMQSVLTALQVRLVT